MDKCSEVLLKPISKSSIEKDIRAMKFDEGLKYFGPIEFSRTYKGYYYDEPEYSIDGIPLNDDELEAMKFATNILGQFKDVGIFKSYGNAIEKVIDKVTFFDSDKEANNSYIQFEQHPTVNGNEFLSPLLGAIRQKQCVTFQYQSFKKQGATNRVVEPYLLREYKSRWYLLSREISTNTYKVFGLERMEELTVTADHFEVDTQVQHASYFEHSVGITVNHTKGVEEVVFTCGEVLYQYLESQPIHASQKIQPISNGYTVTLQVMVTYELIQLLVGFGPEVQVIQPAYLIDHLKERHAKALAQYK
jgi:predicted DNA-binding transcriptional regulator YafY